MLCVENYNFLINSLYSKLLKGFLDKREGRKRQQWDEQLLHSKDLKDYLLTVFLHHCLPLVFPHLLLVVFLLLKQMKESESHSITCWMIYNEVKHFLYYILKQLSGFTSLLHIKEIQTKLSFIYNGTLVSHYIRDRAEKSQYISFIFTGISFLCLF